MAIGLATSVRNARLDLISAAIDAGSAGGMLSIYTASRPATGAAITDQTLLATFTLPDPCAAAASAGVLTLNAIAATTGITDGTAAWARLTDSDGTVVADVSVTETDVGGDIEINTLAVTTGVALSVTSATISEGNA